MTTSRPEVTTCTGCGHIVGLVPEPGTPTRLRRAVDLDRDTHQPTATHHRCGPHGLHDDHPLNTTSPLDPRSRR